MISHIHLFLYSRSNNIIKLNCRSSSYLKTVGSNLDRSMLIIIMIYFKKKTEINFQVFSFHPKHFYFFNGRKVAYKTSIFYFKIVIFIFTFLLTALLHLIGGRVN